MCKVSEAEAGGPDNFEKLEEDYVTIVQEEGQMRLNKQGVTNQVSMKKK